MRLLLIVVVFLLCCYWFTVFVGCVGGVFVLLFCVRVVMRCVYVCRGVNCVLLCVYVGVMIVVVACLFKYGVCVLCVFVVVVLLLLLCVVIVPLFMSFVLYVM